MPVLSPNSIATAPSHGAATRRALAHWGIGMLALVLLDRSFLLMVPAHYRGLPDGRRYHTLYFSRKMQALTPLRERIGVIALGDSRTRHGVMADVLVGAAAPHASGRPSAFNAAPASSGIAFTALWLEHWLPRLPHVHTVVWGISPRMFNRYWDDPVFDLYQASSGFRHDALVRDMHRPGQRIRAAAHLGFERAMSTLFVTYRHRGIIRARTLDALAPTALPRHFTVEPPLSMDPWGFIELPKAHHRQVTDPATVERWLQALAGGRFELDAERWRHFEALVRTLAAKQVRLLCFVPPMHPSLGESPAADADGTPKQAYADLVQRLHALAAAHENLVFVDPHRAGAHDFPAEAFGDFDHLTRRGAIRLSRKLAEHLPAEQVAARTPAGVPRVPKVAPGDAATTPQHAPPDSSPSPSTAMDQDTTPPTVRGMLGDLDYAIRAYPPDNRPLLWAEFADAGSGIDPASVRFFIDDVDITAKCTVTGARVSHQPETTLDAPKLYRFRVVVSDRAGNRTELIWEILLKPC